MIKPAKTESEFLENFIVESNAIEGIYREPRSEEKIATAKFLKLDEITLQDVVDFVSACQPGAMLRDMEGLNVTIGNHTPPGGGISIKTRLQDLLDDINARNISAYDAHVRYEHLHPFMDGNGRSGRVIWLWQMVKNSCRVAPLGFLQTFYYQALSKNR